MADRTGRTAKPFGADRTLRHATQPRTGLRGSGSRSIPMQVEAHRHHGPGFDGPAIAHGRAEAPGCEHVRACRVVQRARPTAAGNQHFDRLAAGIDQHLERHGTLRARTQRLQRVGGRGRAFVGDGCGAVASRSRGRRTGVRCPGPRLRDRCNSGQRGQRHPHDIRNHDVHAWRKNALRHPQGRHCRRGQTWRRRRKHRCLQ